MEELKNKIKNYLEELKSNLYDWYSQQMADKIYDFLYKNNEDNFTNCDLKPIDVLYFLENLSKNSYTIDNYNSDNLEKWRNTIDEFEKFIEEKNISLFKETNEVEISDKEQSAIDRNEFKVNDYITLKLENGKTNIYVNGKKFRQCIRLILNIPFDKIKDYDQIDSIDEAAEINKESIDQNFDIEKQPTFWNRKTVIGASPRSIDYDVNISPKNEFKGHCSNLQAWVENNYDTRLLHRNLAFPLLKKLTDIGDPKAKKVFKDEIAERFVSFYPSVIKFLINGGYLKYLKKEEINTLFQTNLSSFFNFVGREKLNEIWNNIENLDEKEKYDAYDKLINQAKEINTLIEKFPENLTVFLHDHKKFNLKTINDVFFEIFQQIKKADDVKSNFIELLNASAEIVDNPYFYYDIINEIDDRTFLSQHFDFIVEVLYKFHSDRSRYQVFKFLANKFYLFDMSKEHFSKVLDTLKIISKENRGNLFLKILNGINSEQFDLFYKEIECKFFELFSVFKDIDFSIKDILGSDISKLFKNMIDKIKEIPVLKEKFRDFLDMINKFDEEFNVPHGFMYLMKDVDQSLISKNKVDVQTKLIYCLSWIAKYARSFSKNRIYFEFLDEFKDRGLLQDIFVDILKSLNSFKSAYSKFEVFCKLIELAKELNVFENNFNYFLEKTDNFEFTKQVDAISELVKQSKDLQIDKKSLKIKISDLISNLQKETSKSDYDKKIDIFCTLCDLSEKLGEFKELFSDFYAAFDNLNFRDKFRGFEKLFNSVKNDPNNLFSKYYQDLKNSCLNLLDSLSFDSCRENLYENFSTIIDSVKNTEIFDENLIKTKFSEAMLGLDFLPLFRTLDYHGPTKIEAYCDLVNMIKDEQFFTDNYPIFKDTMSKIIDEIKNQSENIFFSKIDNFVKLINNIKDTPLFIDKETIFETNSSIIFDSNEYSQAKVVENESKNEYDIEKEGSQHINGENINKIDEKSLSKYQESFKSDNDLQSILNEVQNELDFDPKDSQDYNLYEIELEEN